MDGADIESWVGRTETQSDIVTAGPLAALSATLDRGDRAPLPGDGLPPAWHWLYFLPVHRQSELGEDGHARRGGFLPPIALPHRMWAGGSIEWEKPLCVGDRIQRASRIAVVRSKQGRSGPLVFVTVRHEISTDAGRAI